MHQPGPMHLSSVALVCLKLQVPLKESQHHSASCCSHTAGAWLENQIPENECNSYISNHFIMIYLSEMPPFLMSQWETNSK